MKKLIIIPLLLLTLSLNATIYYCSPTGSDASADPTNIATPWLTWQKAFTSTTSGDTCYFRDGIYPAYSTAIGAQILNGTNGGTYSNPTCYFNYPGETPVLDCQIVTATTAIGIKFGYCHDSYFKGLTVKNVRQNSTVIPASGIMFLKTVWGVSNNLRFENCVVHNIGGAAYEKYDTDTLYFINCDVYNNCDSLTAYDPGGHGDGWGLFGTSDTYSKSDSSYTYFYGCRAWRCSDQGWAAATNGTIVIDSCWSIGNGNMILEGDVTPKGTGWKFWYSTATTIDLTKTQIIMRNCIAAHNEAWGINFTDVPSTTPKPRVHIYNNFSYANGKDVGKSWHWGWGVYDVVSTDTAGQYDRIYRNNISYNNHGYLGWTNDKDWIPGISDRDYNKFDLVGSTISDADFESLDTTGMLGVGTRQADGSLPVTTFGHLAETSECINAGTDVGLPYSGSYPDIGWSEYNEGPPVTDALNSTTTPYNVSIKQATVGGTVTSDGGGTITARGVCWSTGANPDLTDNVITVSGTTGSFTTTITGLSASTTYHVQSYATNEAGTAYGGDISFTTPEWEPVKSGSVYVFSGGYLIKID